MRKLSAEQQVADSLRHLLEDPKIPATVRAQLTTEYNQLRQLIAKLDNSSVHIVAFGKVSTGKSSILNALSGEQHFKVSPLHGETKHSHHLDWPSFQQQSVVLIDTPGTDEYEGEEREAMARQAAAMADVLLFVLDGDVSASEQQQLQAISNPHRVVIVVLNKADLYQPEELARLQSSIAEKLAGLYSALVTVSARPRAITVVKEMTDGEEQTTIHQPPADVTALKDSIWQLLEKEGKTLTALNAGIFAGRISDTIAERMLEVRSQAAQKIIRTYCIAKGVGVAFNPIPVADLLVAASLDVAMVRQLSKLYGLPLSKADAARLTATIMAQLAVLMGAVWGVNLLSSALKTVSVGLSTTLTAGAQGTLAYYATYLVGQIAGRYFVQGYSWGADGPKKVARSILDDLDRDSVLLEAKSHIVSLLKSRDKAK